MERSLRRFARRIGSFLFLCMVAVTSGGAATIREDFVTDPAMRGWRTHGETNLFQWSSTTELLEVAWDSSKSNSYFHHPLNTILTKHDDFNAAFDLRITDIAVGVTPTKPLAFELAAGFLSLAGATSTNFLRGIGINAAAGPRNVAEFAYFPDSGFGATISPTIISSNNQFAVVFDFPLELSVGDLFGVTMTYAATNQTLSTLMTLNGQPFGPIKDLKLGAVFTDFRLDTFAISSYSDEGADGSILAHGTVDNIVVIVPDFPILDLAGARTNNTWRVEFTGRTNWLYTLERTEDFRSWTPITPATAGVVGRSSLSDTGISPQRAFYRVSAQRP